MTLKEAVVQALLHCEGWKGATILEFADGGYDAIPTDFEASSWPLEAVVGRLLRFRAVTDLGGKGFTGTTEAEIRTMVNERMG